jgi:hypothetical protein
VVVDTLSYQHPDAAYAVDGLMGHERLSGVIRGRKHRTTIPGGPRVGGHRICLIANFTAAARRVSCCREKVREASVQVGGGRSNTSSHQWFSSSDCQAISGATSHS